MDNKTKILIVFPVILNIILILIANSINLGGELFYLKEEFSKPESEMQTLQGAKQFPIQSTPSDITTKQQQKIYVSRELKSPIDFNSTPSAKSAFPPVPLESLVPQTGNGKNVLSLIVISEKVRIAIIKGFVVKEGDSIDGMKVAKIEPDRVLLKNKTTQWLYLEKTK